METSLSFAFGFVLNKASGLSLSSSVTHCEPSAPWAVKGGLRLGNMTTFQVCCWEHGEVAESDDACSHFQCRDAPGTD